MGPRDRPQKTRGWGPDKPEGTPGLSRATGRNSQGRPDTSRAGAGRWDGWKGPDSPGVSGAWGG